MTGLVLSVIGILTIRKFNNEYCLTQNHRIQSNTPIGVKMLLRKIWEFAQTSKVFFGCTLFSSVIEITAVIYVLFFG